MNLPLGYVYAFIIGAFIGKFIGLIVSVIVFIILLYLADNTIFVNIPQINNILTNITRTLNI